MKLSRTVSYAVNATLQLAQTSPRVPVPCSRLAADGQMPERFLLQVLRHLVTHGILRSTRGVDGGYFLDRDPQQVSLLDVIEAIDGPLGSMAAGELDPTQSNRKLCHALEQVGTNLRNELDAIKIADLLPTAAKR